MHAHKTDQRRLRHRGRDFHFVSYEGQAANPKRDIAATSPAWYLMAAGKRWEVMPHDAEQTPEEVDQLLLDWLDANVFAAVRAAR